MTRPSVLISRCPLLAGLASVAIAFTAFVLPVSALMARLTALPLGNGTATITWTGKGGLNPPPTTIRGSARGLSISAINRPPTASGLAGGHLPATLTLANVKGTIGGAPFAFKVTVSTASLAPGSANSNAIAQVVGTFRNQRLTATVGEDSGTHALVFTGHIGSDTIIGTFGNVLHKGNRSTVHATFELTR